MSGAVQPESTATTGIGRLLTPDEFHQARQLGPDQLTDDKFPPLPPIKPPARESTRVGAGPPNPNARPLTGLARILTQHVAEPLVGLAEHPAGPLAVAGMLATSAIPVVGPAVNYAFMGLMGKNVLDYAAQKAAEESLPSDVQKLAEQDPDRISGRSAALDAAGLAAGPLIGKMAKGMKGLASGEVAARELAGTPPSVIKGHVAAVTDAWNKIFNPSARSPQALQAANILRATTGQSAAAYEQAAFKLDEFRRAIDPLPDADKLGFIDAIEGGKSQASPEFEKAASTIRQTLDATRDAIRNLGTGKLEHFIKDYFPHIWEDPEKAGNAFEAAQASAASKSPMEGSKSFLKERSIPTTLEGMQLGLKPVSMNPVDLTLLKLREMQRYLMAHQSLNELKDAGLVKFVSSGEQVPDGHAFIDDKIATVFGPREGAVKVPEGAVKSMDFQGGAVSTEPLKPEDISVPGMRIMGRYSAPEPVARVVNNYLSPGLRGNALYDAYRGLGNMLNQAQLGLSAFHLGFTSMDAMVSRVSLGLEYVASGQPLEGLGTIASAPAAPVSNLLLGKRIRAAYLNPEAATPDMRSLANAVQEAGGRVRMDSFYQNSAPERMVQAWRAGEYGKAAALSLPAVFEYSMKPLMEHIVPMQKLGVFGDLAKKVMADLPEDASLADRRESLAKAWDSVDNRMGQVVYDNLFWNKTVKDLAMASVRSVGWNLGTIRELGGGIKDIATVGSRVSAEDAGVMTHRMAYVLSLPITVGLYGALYQLLRTGEGPSEMKDYFYPKTGETDANGDAERVQLPSYMKDLFAYAGSPWQTIKHKEAPLLASVTEMLNNQDYFGDQIRNPNDPVVQQIQQEAEYMFKSMTPFSITNMMEQSKRGDQSTTTKLGNWFGITPAPRSAVRSDAENLMASFGTHTTGRTPEQAEAAQTRFEILSALRGPNKDNPEELNKAISGAIERHELTPPDVARLMKRAGMTPSQERFRGLTVDQALQVFNVAKPDEKAKFAELLVTKLENAAKRGSREPVMTP